MSITQTPTVTSVRSRRSSPVRYIILGLAILGAGIVVTVLAVYWLPG